MIKNQNGDRMLWAEIIRVLATVSVIFLHVVAEILNQYGNIPSFVWWTGNIYESLVRPCVPLFVMLTGVFMLNKTYELSDFLKKRFARIILPFLFWSIIYALFAWNTKVLENQEVHVFEILKWLSGKLLRGVSFHFWYIYMIIGIYLFIPIINKWIQKATEKEILYFIFIWLIALIINQPWLSKFKGSIDLNYFSGFIGYLVLGYYLSVKSFAINKQTVNLISLFLIVTGFGLTLFGTYFLSFSEKKFNEYFYNYFALNVLMSSTGVFMMFKNLQINYSPIAIKIISFISKYSYGIYLVHILVLNFMKTYGIDCDFINPIFAIPIVSLGCLFISILIIYSINKLPYGKYISG
ncbi:acyltransferase [Flavobacterium mesophilum]|uniref:acyltransferase n=1 Tax=Flavobacterium mesophilum TaxID=3143495 RepID=UPI0031D87135